MISSTKASTASALPLCLRTTQCQAQGLVYSSGSIILFWIDKRRLCLRHFKKIMASSRDVTSLKEDLLAWKWNVTIWNILEGLDLFNIPNKGCQCQLNFTCLTEAYVFTGSLILPLIDHKMVANQIPIMVHCQSNFSVSLFIRTHIQRCYLVATKGVWLSLTLVLPVVIFLSSPLPMPDLRTDRSPQIHRPLIRGLIYFIFHALQRIIRQHVPRGFYKNPLGLSLKLKSKMSFLQLLLSNVVKYYSVVDLYLPTSPFWRDPHLC